MADNTNLIDFSNIRDWGEFHKQYRWDITHAEMVGVPFAIIAVTPIEMDGEPRYVCTVQFWSEDDEQQIQREMLLGSDVACKDMVEHLSKFSDERDAFPIIVTMKKSTSKKGQPYYNIVSPDWQWEDK